MVKEIGNNIPGRRKLFVASDIHGYFRQWQAALRDAGWEKDNESHVLVVLGDLLDRGPQPLKCLEFVNALPSRRKILVRGNHEDLMEEMIARRESKQHDWHNGTIQTAMELTGYGDTLFTELDVFDAMRRHEEYNTYISSLIDFYENDDYVLCHGWIPGGEDWRKGDWKAARWVNGMDAWAKGVRVPGKTVVCGHWHTSWGHHHLHHDSPEWDNKFSTNPAHKKANFSPFVDDGILAIDACTAASGKMNVVVLEEGESYA